MSNVAPCSLCTCSYGEAYDSSAMLFMDYRRHHTGIWEGSATRLDSGNHPNANDGLWGAAGEAPSFLYAMPLGGGRVFLEETCLVARPALPFRVLKRRLQRRMAAMGIKVLKVSARARRLGNQPRRELLVVEAVAGREEARASRWWSPYASEQLPRTAGVFCTAWP
jgi:hypothetical protein